MSNLQETFKKLGFEPDAFGNLALCVDSGELGNKTYATIMICDYDTEDIPTDETKKFITSVCIEDKNGELLHQFQNIKEIENV